MHRIRAYVGIGIVVFLPLAAIRSLHGVAARPWFHIDYSDPIAWARTVDLVDAIVALSRIAALAVAYWCAITTLLYLIAVFADNERLRRITTPLALPVVRRLADRTIAGTLAIGVLTTPLLAAGPAPDQRPVTADAPAGASSSVSAGYVPPALAFIPVLTGPIDVQTSRSSFDGRPVTTAPPEQKRSDQRPEQRPVAPESAAGQHDVAVKAGDSLWALAERRLAEVLARSVLDHEVAPYWRAVVDGNLPRLRSGDPDLISPGEIVTMPDPTPFTPRGSSTAPTEQGCPHSGRPV